MLITKLNIPLVKDQLLYRYTLYSKLNEGLKYKFILVSAPAGFGKSTLISSWVRQYKILTAWFSVSLEDNDSVIFISYVIHAIRKVQNNFGKKPLELLQSSIKSSVKSILNLVINELIILNKKILLIIDDYHLIVNTEINELVNHLLYNLPENLQIAILTRCDPDLKLSRLRSQQQLFEIRAADLNFRKDEISELFSKKLKLQLTESDIEKLHQKTEGWVAGLQLTALSMQNHSNHHAFIEEFSVSNRYVMGYLIDEVLQNQSVSIKTFLMHTSILEFLTAPLCNSLLDRNDSQKILDELAVGNLFIFPQDDESKNYRYHHLFAELLQQKLHEENDDIIEKLHNRASDWYSENNMPFLGIKHAVKAKNFEKSAQIFASSIYNMWKEGLHNTILSIGQSIPQSYMFNNPEMCLYYSWVLLDAGDLMNAALFLKNAEEFYNFKPENKKSSQTESKQLYGKIAVAWLRYYANIPKPNELEKYRLLALKNLKTEDAYWLSWAWFVSAGLQIIRNNTIEAIECYNKALAYAKKTDNLGLISFITISLGHLEFRLGQIHVSYSRCKELLSYMNEQGYLQYSKEDSTYAPLFASLAAIECYWMDLDNAEKNIHTAYELSLEDPNINNKAIVLVTYSLISFMRDSKETSQAKIDELESLIRHNNILPEVSTLYISWKGFMLVIQGKLTDAVLFFNEQKIDLQNEIPVSEVYRYTPYALWLIMNSKYDKAENLLAKLLVIAQSLSRIENVVELKIIQSILYHQTANRKKAIESLVESMEYASKENILVYYIAYFEIIKNMFNDVFTQIATKKTDVTNVFVRSIKTEITKYKNKQTGKTVDLLSTRELDVLKLIDAHLTNQQIAEKLFISLHTVKSHVKNILLKLEVDRRSKAAGKAREKELI